LEVDGHPLIRKTGKITVFFLLHGEDFFARSSVSLSGLSRAICGLGEKPVKALTWGLGRIEQGRKTFGGHLHLPPLKRPVMLCSHVLKKAQEHTRSVSMECAVKTIVALKK
jgi:hypothetical protein